MAVSTRYIFCFLILPLSVGCANQTVYHTMLYVRVLNYTNTLQPAVENISSSVYDSCCYTMPLQNCTHFCKTVFSVCIESECDKYLFNITFNYNTGRIYDENYGVERINVPSIKNHGIIIDVTEIKVDIFTGLRTLSKIDRFATMYARPPSGSFWLSRFSLLRLQNNTSTIVVNVMAFCESNWYNPQQRCSDYVPTNGLQGVHYNIRNHTFDAQLDCTTDETSKLTFITKRPYKYTKQILEAQLSRFVADRVCSSIATDVTIRIKSVRYDSNLLRVVFSSHCNLHITSIFSTANKFIQVSDLKIMQALMFMSSYEERQYFIDPVQRIDFSNSHNMGNFQLFFRLKRFSNPNNIYFLHDYKGYKQTQCPTDGCTPSFHLTYKGFTHILHYNSPVKELSDCFGNLVDKSNPTEKTNNTLMWHSNKIWDITDPIKLKVYHSDNKNEPIVLMDIELDNINVVSSSYLLAIPMLISKTNNITNTSVDIEMMVWCSTGFYGRACNVSCPPENTRCNIGQCIEKAGSNEASSSQLNFHCRQGRCNDGVCKCPDGLAGDRCNVASKYTLPYNKTYHFIDDSTANSTCANGFTNFNCDERDFCDNSPCQHGKCNNDINIYNCECDKGYKGFDCNIKIYYCDSDPCQNNSTCIEEQTNYICNCQQGYTGKNCEKDINYCYSTPCQNNATCLEELTTYKCNCQPGYNGTNCETDINYCYSNPCQNNATCLEELTNYKCSCQPGYNGTNCETDINYCDSNPCQNNATCLEELTTYKCNCQPGYNGTNCETDINYCDSNPCQNNATCLEELTTYKCSCMPGYNGTNCETDINYCYSIPCQNNATCLEELTTYKCSCQPGYNGTNCETDINYCDSNPCQNNATCLEELTNYKCSCQPGYNGTNCETDINYCDSNPCQNNATCLEKLTNYICSCQPGYNGTNCETNTNYCDSNPCQNNATCLEELTNYRCSCQPGYNETNCETDNNYCYSNPCQNNSTCLEELTNYICSCQPGYNGTNCETDINYCDSNPCQNNATCIEELTNYRCNCQPRFTGINCDTNINYCGSEPCQNNATCLEELKNYKCNCQPEFTGINCETDIYYCDSYPCQNNATCIEELKDYKCSCQPDFTGINCENHVAFCLQDTCKNNGTCNNINGTYICFCLLGFMGKQCEFASNLTLQTRDAIVASCASFGWNISINVTILKQLDPTILTRNIHFGDNACSGKEVGNLLFFQQGFQECLTSKQISGDMILYVNDLFYAIYDPINPYIIRRHGWTFTVQCDVKRNQATSSHVHHDVNAQHIEISSQYQINLAFYKDVNFMHELPGNPLHVNLGDDIYVKVFTMANDWTTKMRLHTCYTKPSDSAVKNMTYYIIKDGCEVDSNTHIISQSTHETKFVFQDFEYSTSREGLNIYCNATFCDTKDYTPGCAQSCLLP